MAAPARCAQTVVDDSPNIEAFCAAAGDHPSDWGRFSSLQKHLAGQQLFQQGSVPHGVYFISSGYVKLNGVDRNGRQLIVGLRGEGSMLGASSVTLDEAYPVSAVAVTNCEARYFSSEVFVALLKADSCFSWLVQVEHSRHARQLFTQIARLGFCSARNCLGELLWQLISATSIEGHQKRFHLKLPLKQWEVAQLIAVTPEHLSRTVKQMQREGILQWEKGVVTIFDMKRLCESTNL